MLQSGLGISDNNLFTFVMEISHIHTNNIMMKSVFLFLFFLFSFSVFSQTTPKNVNNTYDIKAEYPGGDNAFRNDFIKMVHAYMDLSSYKVEGPFVFVFDIDEKGKISQLSISPKVKNHEVFNEDMQFAMRKVKSKWKPALKDSKPVKSKYFLTITFERMDYDHN